MYMLNGLAVVLICSNFAMYNNLVMEQKAQIKGVIDLVYQKKTPLLNTVEFLSVCSAYVFDYADHSGRAGR